MTSHVSSRGRYRRWTSEQRRLARTMRLEGRPYSEIERALGVSKSTLSGWLKDVPLTDEQRAFLRTPQRDAVRRRAESRRARRIAAQRRIVAEARAQVGALTDRELFVAGVVAYWAEGSKAKPWSTKSPRVKFCNSDPTMISLFLRWLAALGIGPDDLVFRLQIHENADVGCALDFWSSVVGVSPRAFKGTTLKRHKPRTSRRNTGATYVGCLTIDVRRSTGLYYRIAGWYEGIVNLGA